jgi:uracil-DNA glycosylase family 4
VEEKCQFKALAEIIQVCVRCPRLVKWRTRVAREKRRAYVDEEYWGRPVPGFGDPTARLLVLGLAPGAHGANRTGRVFTGDPSGDWLFRSLYRAGYTNQPESRDKSDGLRLIGCFVTSPVRCVPPDNRPLPDEQTACRPFLEKEFRMLTDIKVVLALGGFAWNAYFKAIAGMGLPVPRPRPRFGHGATVLKGLPHVLMGCYHPSQYNTSTGRLTEKMLDEVVAKTKAYATARDLQG